MPREYSWSELKIGLLSGALIVALAASILLFARVGALHGDRSKLVVITKHAPGVLPGTEVWLAGEKIGLVKNISLRPVTTDTMQRVSIETEILTKYMPQIRKNSFADIRPGGNLIGSPIVYISPGTLTTPEAKNGDTIVTKSVGVINDVTGNVSQLVSRLTVLADSTGKAVSLLNSEAGAVGAFTARGLPRIASVSGTISSLFDQAQHGTGTAALITHGDLGLRFRSLLAAKDSITELMNSGNGTLGRFHRDSTLAPTIAHLRSQLDSLSKMAANSKGGVARFKSDSAIAGEMAKARAQLDSLMKDVKKHPFKYL
jgi:hypothetical protein